MILVGFEEFKEDLIAITVVGISCKDAVFNKTSIAIELQYFMAYFYYNFIYLRFTF